MRPYTTDALPGPSAAERVRTVLARASSLSLTTTGQDYDLLGMHTVDRDGRISLHPPAGDPLTRQVAEAPHGTLACLLEFTDIAPTAARERVRARVTVSGVLSAAAVRDTDRHDHGCDHGHGGGTSGDGDGGALRLDAGWVQLRTATGSVDVPLDAYARAEADPLAVEEAAMLTHLADAHGDLVGGLVEAAGLRLPRDIVRTVPYALDSRSVTLRCEHAHGHCDLRLLFPAPARDGAEVGERIRQLLTAPRTCAHRHHTTGTH
ncbi:DUF2470 domain-containing protein [Streptomyces sp. NPDC047130]|uniref:DUF2470 domain-containing protein n=1 Tax=Streptomyces sp. NPDC047130 TaxID=3155261 RepID=UPI0034100489